MSDKPKRSGRDFYVCPHCGHADPNAIDYLLATPWYMMMGEKCFKCGQLLFRSGFTFGVTWAIWTVAAYLPFRFALYLRRVLGIDPGDTVFFELLGGIAVVTLILFLPRLVYRFFGLPMYLPEEQPLSSPAERQ